MKAITKISFTLIFTICTYALGIAQEAASSDKTTVEFKVEGVCDMCKKTIENAAFIKGVKFAEWDNKTSMLKVIFKSNKVSEDDIHKSVAKAGYTTSKEKATDEAYNSLPKCCRYKELEKH